MRDDTEQWAKDALDTGLRRRSGVDRLRMTCEMLDLARALVLAGIRAEMPDASEVQVLRALLDRMYGDELSVADRDALAARRSRARG